ncbi:MAG: SpoIIE family protein phosphatase [Bacteroidia bacterium]|nr:SpoIIE family protein phosphatase [Bacteroidia bacterium]
MLETQATSADIKSYRKLFALGSSIYFVFWFISHMVGPNVYDPLWGRAFVSLSILAALLLSYRYDYFRKKIVTVAYFLSYLLTFHFIFLVIMNRYSSDYCLGMMVIVYAIALVFKESFSLLLFFGISFSAIGVGFYFVPEPQINPFLFINLLLTAGLVSYLVLSNRLNAHENLRVKNTLLNEAYQQINEQKMIVEEKNKNITDSINYAKRIQDAILPSDEKVNSLLPESFVLFLPKDIVSGDFYWCEQWGNQTLIAAVDCTGHGVPGAFMSIVGFNLLNQCVHEHGLTKPAVILNNLNRGLSKIIKQKSKNDSVKDGMDISLCSINRKNKKLEFAGAYNPLWLIRNGGLTEIKADKTPIGASAENTFPSFTNYEVDLQSGDAIYIFSDGYPDQFGGPAGKKFKYKQLQQLLLSIQSKSMAEQKQALIDTIKRWAGSLEQVDDILIIGVKI